MINYIIHRYFLIFKNFVHPYSSRVARGELNHVRAAACDTKHHAVIKVLLSTTKCDFELNKFSEFSLCLINTLYDIFIVNWTYY